MYSYGATWYEYMYGATWTLHEYSGLCEYITWYEYMCGATWTLHEYSGLCEFITLTGNSFLLESIHFLDIQYNAYLKRRRSLCLSFIYFDRCEEVCIKPKK